MQIKRDNTPDTQLVTFRQFDNREARILRDKLDNAATLV
jgi:hypothetical protein